MKKPNPTMEMLRLNKREWVYILIGCISALCNGGIQPAFGVILSKLTAVRFFLTKVLQMTMNFY